MYKSMNLLHKTLIALFALATMLWGCAYLVNEDMTKCPQGVNVMFYSKTPCAVDSTFIGQVSNLHLFAFNEREVLASIVTMENVNLDRNFQAYVPVSNGYYTFIGWAGVNEKFDVASFTVGLTTKDDLMLRLKSIGDQAEDLSGHQVWQGISPVVLLENPKDVGSQCKYTAVNLQEVTNRINVEVELDESILEDTNPRDFVIEVSSANGSMNIDGSMPLNTAELKYPTSLAYTDTKVMAYYSLMDLQIGYNNKITVRNIVKDEVIWESDLLGTILLKNSNVNLACDNDFDVKFVIKDRCLNCYTYICWAIYVNGWQIHSYETELGG